MFRLGRVGGELAHVLGMGLGGGDLMGGDSGGGGLGDSVCGDISLSLL